MNLSGHLWTVGSLLGRMIIQPEPPSFVVWRTSLEDPAIGGVRISGSLSHPSGARDLVILVHGLGGSAEGGYMVRAARAADALGLACLRLNLRGADGEAGDFYHGGLTADLHAAVADSELEDYRRLFVLGFSLGGHVALRFATETREPRVCSVAAICAPLDLAGGVDAIDRPGMAPYRKYLLDHLRDFYSRVARFGDVPTAPEELRQIRTLRQWDSLTVVPRFGFTDADDYYAKASVGPVIEKLRRPALLLSSENDPMAPPGTVSGSLERFEPLESSMEGDLGAVHCYLLDASSSGAGAHLRVHRARSGGHLAFPRHLDLGVDGPKGYLSQTLLWLLRQN